MPAQPSVGFIAGTIALGPDAQVAIGRPGAAASYAFAAVSGTYREQGDRAETTDTFNTGQKNIKVGLGQFSADLELQQDQKVSIHQGGLAPSVTALGLRVRGIVALAIFPFGQGGISYYIPYFNVLECDGDFRVQGSEPQKMRIRGESNGPYYMLGDL